MMSLRPADLDQVLTKLRNLDIDIIEAAEVDRGRSLEAGEEEEGAATTFWMTRCGCICGKWARCRC